MNEVEFANYKKSVLEKGDKSKKGGEDEKIKKLNQVINTFSPLVTLSSCSGRVVLLNVSQKYNKKNSFWVFSSHDTVNTQTLWNSLKNFDGDGRVYLKFEGAILHVACKSLRVAKSLMEWSRYSGFTRSVILSVEGKVVVELISNPTMTIPVKNNGETLITKKYLNELVSEGNELLEGTWEILNKLKDNLRETRVFS